MKRESNQLREHMEVISSQLMPDANNPCYRRKTIHDHLATLVSLAQEQAWHEKYAPSRSKQVQKTSMYVLAGICLFLFWHGSISGGEKENWLTEHQYAIKSWSIGLGMIFVGITIEESGLMSTMLKYNVTKVVSSLALSALIVYSAGRASSAINDVFAIDASAMPYTRALLSGWIAFTYLEWPLLGIIGLFAAINIIAILDWGINKFFLEKEVPNFSWSALAVVAISILVMSNVGSLLFRSLANDQLPTKVYQLARFLEFNSNYTCSNIEPGSNVVFIGASQEKVLVDSSSFEQEPSLADFFGRPAEAWEAAPRHFLVMKCEMPASTSDATQKSERQLE